MIDTERLRISLLNHKFRALIFPNELRLMNIKTEKQLFTILLSKERIEVLDEYKKNPDVILSGDSGVIEEILYGKVKLLDSKRLNRIAIEGGFRHQLLFETILWFNQSITSAQQVSKITNG